MWSMKNPSPTPIVHIDHIQPIDHISISNVVNEKPKPNANCPH